MKTRDEIKKEIQLAELGRNTYRAIRCAQESSDLSMAKIATDWESMFQRRLDRLATSLAKAKKA